MISNAATKSAEYRMPLIAYRAIANSIPKCMTVSSTEHDAKIKPLESTGLVHNGGCNRLKAGKKNEMHNDEVGVNAGITKKKLTTHV